MAENVERGMSQADIDAAYAVVEDMKGQADGFNGVVPLWHGWALREAYLAGLQAERERCARVAEEHWERVGRDCANHPDACFREIAAAIRHPQAEGVTMSETIVPTVPVTVKIGSAIRWQNGNVMVFDEQGRQVPELQGRYEDVRDRVLAAADERTLFEHGVWHRSLTVVTRQEW